MIEYISKEITKLFLKFEEIEKLLVDKVTLENGKSGCNVSATAAAMSSRFMLLREVMSALCSYRNDMMAPCMSPGILDSSWSLAIELVEKDRGTSPSGTLPASASLAVIGALVATSSAGAVASVVYNGRTW